MNDGLPVGPSDNVPRPTAMNPRLYDAGGENGRLRCHLPVARHRLHRMGGQHHVVLDGQSGDRLEGVEDLDVGIDVEHRRSTTPEEHGEEPRLQGGGELRHVVHRRHPVELRNVVAEVVDVDDLERLVVPPDLVVDVVEDEDRQRPVRVMVTE